MLLLAQPATRILHLAADDIYERDGRTYLILGHQRTLLPPTVASLVHRLLDHPVGSQIIVDGPRHLFPSKRLSTQAVTAGALTRKLNTCGIAVLPARNTTRLP